MRGDNMGRITTGVKVKGEGVTIEVMHNRRNDTDSTKMVGHILEAYNATKDGVNKDMDIYDCVSILSRSIGFKLKDKRIEFIYVKVRIAGNALFAERTVTADECADKPTMR